MASYKEHCEDCVRILKNDFGYVHAWLDEYISLMGAEHRKMRHHWEGVDEVYKKWGEDAAIAAEIHIKKDMYNLPIPYKKDYIGGNGSWPVGDRWNSKDVI